MHSLSNGELGELVELINRNQPAAAEARARELLGLHPGVGMLWKILGVAQVRQGRDALPALQQAAALLPQDAEAHGNLGSALYAAGRPAEALESLRRALRLQPRDGAAMVEAANALRDLGQLPEAVTLYQEALRLDGRQPQVLNNLGNVLAALGHPEEAIVALRLALNLAPSDARIHCNLGNALRQAAQYPEAIAAHERALELDPALAPAHNGLGLALLAAGRPQQAMACFHQALAQMPVNAELLANLADAQRDAGLMQDAADQYHRALELNPDFVRARLSLAVALRALRQPQQAEQHCRAVLAQDPGQLAALCLLGDLSADRGEFAAALALFERALAIEPRHAPAYLGIASNRRMGSEDVRWLQGAQALAGSAQPLGHEIDLNYALGKYFDDTAQYEQAFAHYRTANELTKRRGYRYDGAKLVALVDEIIATFDAPLLAQAPGQASPSQLPLLVVGMPRSGTSLIEQILASHPEVVGAGEVTFWDGAYRQWRDADGAGEARGALEATIASRYLQRLAAAGAAPRRVVDKMPANFLHLGLIQRIFPHARIIHVTRHPLDTGLSNYFQHFAGRGSWANDLGHIAHYYTQYRRIMQHWRAVLPAANLLEVPYEELIAGQERWSRRMLEFAGLSWDPRCLEFHQTERRVVTASKWQVRQKLHAGAVGRWQHYQSFIEPLRPLLEIK